MGKKIGIKLADGTFYPIMEDGIPGKKLMELTTVQDNQTAASIDVYRSETGTMDDAEYVDTLKLSELIPHPGGEATFNFSLQLDEENTLSVEVIDSESGKVIRSRSSLVNLPSNKDSDDLSAEDAQSLDALPNVDLSDLDLEDFASVDSLPSGKIYSTKDDEESTLESTLPELDTDLLNQNENVSEDSSSIVDLPDFDDVSFDTSSSLDGQYGKESTSLSETDFGLTDSDLDDFQSLDNDFGNNYIDALVGKDTTEEPIARSTDFNLPDFDFENNRKDFGMDSDGVYEDSLPDFSKFELPDFYESEKNDFSFESESGLFTESDFQDPVFHTTGIQNSSSPFDFSGLYDDRETEFKQEESRKRRGTVAVVICVACALICVGILLYILFLIPNRLISPGGGDSVRIQTITAEQMLEEPDITEAIEDTIVIMETPSVVPAPPPQPKNDSKVTTYRVKWGDTLWDIAQSYYGNPWLYKKIATANRLSNPDRIVAGTILTLPSY